MNKIKKVITHNIIIDDNNDIWEITNRHAGKAKLQDFSYYMNYAEYHIINNELKTTSNRHSAFNPIRKLTTEEMVDYLHLII